MRLTTTLNDLNRSSCHQVFIAGWLSFVLGSVILVLLLPLIAAGQRANLTDDAQVSSNTPNQNFGSKTTVQVSGTNLRGFFKFKLTPNLPNGTTGGQIEKATLKVYVSAVNTPGSLELHRVDGVWDEGSITNNSAPPIGVLLSTVAVEATQQDRWIVIDVTLIVKDWLDGAQPNNGVALLAAPGGINVTFNSKENQATSHEPILEISLNHVAEADHALTADNATTATIASTANALSSSASVNGNQINGDLTNATIAGNRVTGTVANSTTAATANALSGILPIANGGTGSSTQNFVDLSTNQTIAGNKTFSNAVNTNTQYNIGGFRILHNTGASNLFAGIAAGDVNTGSNNAFYGFNAGKFNTTGSLNSFFGQGAGQANTTGQNNAFFGSAAGTNNTTAVRNSFFGSLAGVFNTTGGFDSFFGATSGFNNTTGVRNAFFGNQSGLNNTSGNSNVFIGDIAGFNNTSGSGNTFVGQNAGSSNTTENQNTFVGAGANGSPGISNSTAIGANSQVTTSNTMVLGTNALTVQVPGNLNVSGSFTASIPAGSSNYVQNTKTQQPSSNFNISGDGTAGGTFSANFLNAATEYHLGGQRVLSNAGASNMFVGVATGADNTTGSGNSFFGAFAGEANTTGDGNSFFGNLAGRFNTSGSTNSFFGWTSGVFNTTGTANSFFGFNAGNANTTGGENAFFGNSTGKANITGGANSFFGSAAGQANTTGSSNSFFGQQAGKANDSGDINSFFGERTGENNTSGNQNSFFGGLAGLSNTTGARNTFVGLNAGTSNTTENDNTFIGFNSNGAPGINNATAIGANSQVTTSDTIVLGTNAITVQIPGNLSVANSFSANGSNLTNLNASNITNGTLDNARLGVVPVANGGTGSPTQNFVDLSTTQTVSGNKSFTNSINVGNSTTGGFLLATNTVNRFLELGSNVSFDSVPGTVVGIRLKATNPAENYSYGIFHGSNVYPGALIFRKDDESISPGDLRNRLIIAGNGDILVNPGSVGIGTPTPTQKLEVNNGNLRLFRNDGGRPAFIMNLSGAAWTQLIQPDSRLDFVPAEGPGAAVLTLSPSGNVGIGTTAPGNLLHLTSAAGAPGIQIDNTTSAKSFSLLNVAGSNPRLSLNDITAGTERLVVDSSGNVGIGTTTPTQKLEVNGNLRIDGDFVATGAKSAVVTLADKREVALYAVESTGNWFEDFGSGKLKNGVVEIQLDSLFAQTVNTDVDYHVFLTPNGNCNGLYVARKTAVGFEVRELGQGTSSISFDYRIVARRKGYENVFSGKR